MNKKYIWLILKIIGSLAVLYILFVDIILITFSCDNSQININQLLVIVNIFLAISISINIIIFKEKLKLLYISSFLLICFLLFFFLFYL